MVSQLSRKISDLKSRKAVQRFQEVVDYTLPFRTVYFLICVKVDAMITNSYVFFPVYLYGYSVREEWHCQLIHKYTIPLAFDDMKLYELLISYESLISVF